MWFDFKMMSPHLGRLNTLGVHFVWFDFKMMSPGLGRLNTTGGTFCVKVKHHWGYILCGLTLR